MRLRIIAQAMLLGLFLLQEFSAQAAIYYLAPSGSDANTGVVSSAPWRTWSYAFGHSTCGDTVIVMDGVYPITTYGVPTLSKTCTASTRYVIQAQNERQAQISSDGSNYALLITGSAYVTIDGLYFRSSDNNCCAGYNFDNVSVQNSTFVTITNSVVSHNNRYQNTAMIRLQNTDDSLVEDTELYYYHRHGMQIGGNSDRNVARRVYCNSRGYADISGGFVSGTFGPRGDSCVIGYPTGGSTITVDNIIENSISEGSGSGFWAETYNGPHRTKWYGNISLNDTIGMLLKARGTSLAQQPYQNDVKDLVVITPVGVGIQLRGNRDTTVTNATVYDSGSNTGFYVDVEEPLTGSGIYGFTATNVLSTLNTTGFLISETPTWSCVNCKAFGNTTNYNPASSAFYTPTNPPTATDPQLGTCRVWRPDGSAAKSNNWGADILYRYQNGALTGTPLWDPVTGVFPHGALIMGLNDMSGSSLFDVHARLNVNMNGCSFPAGYGGSTPTNPGSRVASTDLTGAHIHVVDIGTDSLTVAVMVRHDGFNVADAISVTSSCGGESIPLLLSAMHTLANDRSQALFGKINPTSGTCTLTPTFNDPTRVSGWVMVSATEDNVASYNSPSGDAALSVNPTINVPTSSTEKIIDFLATSNTPTLSVGPSQIFLKEQSHSGVDLRGATSIQPGSNDGEMSWTLGTSAGWVLQGVSLIPSGGGSGTATFTLTKYRIDGLLGSPTTAEVTLGSLAAQDTQGNISIGGAGRIRAEILIGSSTSAITSLALYCRKNGGAYAQITNIFGSNDIRLYGPGAQPTIPTHGSPTTPRFSGPFQAGVTARDSSAVTQLPAIPSGTRTEVDYQVVIGNTAVSGDVFDCQIRKSGGTPFDAYTVTPSILAVGPSASMGF